MSHGKLTSRQFYEDPSALGSPATTVTSVDGVAGSGEGGTTQTSEIIIIQQPSAEASNVDTLKLYAKSDGELYRVNELGVEDQISFDQPLNTTNDVVFNTIQVTDITTAKDTVPRGLNDFITTTEQDLANLKSQTQNIELISTVADDTQITGDVTVSQTVSAQDYVTAYDTTPVSLNGYITTNTNNVIDLQNKTVNITSTTEARQDRL